MPKKIHSHRWNRFTGADYTTPMLIRDVDQLLDMQCVVAFRDEYGLLDLSQKLGLKVPCTAFVDANKISILFFLDNELTQNRNVKIYLDSIGAKNLGSTWIVELSDSVINELSYLRSFLKIPSVILDEISLDNGTLYTRVRFHRNFLEEVSNEVVSILKKTSKISLEYIGKGGGLISTLKKIDERIPLFYFSLESEPPESSKKAEEPPLSGKWIREIKFTSDDLVRGLYAVNSPLDQLNGSIDKISGGENLYEGPAKNDVLEFFRKKTAEAFIPMFSKVQGYDGKRMSMDFVVPEGEMQNFLSVISETLKTFPEWKINMSNAGKLVNIVD
ncbi:hypothetical protein Thermo_01798 [Thermoplasmatales archaeon]|nr:hypothetical protein Thermo_01798 [Thermoplasmatales archaeon]